MPQVGIFVAGLLVLTFALVIRDGWFGFLTLIPSTISLKYLPWPWRLAGVSGVGFISAVSQTAGTQGSLLFRLLMFFVALTVDQTMLWFLAWFLWRSDKQDHERRQALADLNEANGRLVATIAENEDLHRQLIAQAREAGVAEERRRMAREIHDTLAQGLTGIVTQLQAAEQAASRPPGRSRGLAAACRGRDPAGAGQPLRGAPIGGRAAPRAARALPAERGAGRRGRALGGAERDPGAGADDGNGAADPAGDRVRAAPRRPGGARERGQARARDAGRADRLLHGERGRARRARRRRRVRPGQPCPRAAASA